MCGRYALWGIDDLGGRFLVVDPALGFRSHFNIAPSTENPVVVGGTGGNHCRMMQWGLVPHLAKDTTAPSPHPINARAESLAKKPMFRDLLAEKRCLVPASGFYEWKKDGARKVPFYIHVRDDPVFAFAGLYDVWRDASGTPHETYTIITTDANRLLLPIHNRMPVIVRRDFEQRWLSPSPLPADEVKAILAPYPAVGMEAYPVSSRVNSPGADDEGLVRPVGGLWADFQKNSS